MNKAFASLSAIALLTACTAAYALYSVNPTGTWPKSWPSELEPLRKQARTLVGPKIEARHFAIHFTSREQFEAAWPSLLKVKTKGAPIIVTRGPNFFLSDSKGGVVIHCPPEGQNKELRDAENLEVVDDGETVVFERLKVPKGTPVVDKRQKTGS